MSEKLSYFLHCFVVVVPCLLDLDADDWRRRLYRRLHREDDSGNDRGRVSFHPFPQATAQNPSDDQQCQPDKAQLKINAVVFNQGVQRVENGIEQFSGIQVHGSSSVFSSSVSCPNRSRGGCQPRQHVFPKRRSSECSPPKSPACKRVKFDCDALMCHVRLKFMVRCSFGKSLRRLDDGEDCRLEWGRKFFPSRDYLGQFGA